MQTLNGNNQKRRTNVTVACVHCKASHVACEAKRPCTRCVNSGRASTCVDVIPKKRGRPRLRDIVGGGGSMYGSTSSSGGDSRYDSSGAGSDHSHEDYMDNGSTGSSDASSISVLLALAGSEKSGSSFNNSASRPSSNESLRTAGSNDTLNLGFLPVSSSQKENLPFDNTVLSVELPGLVIRNIGSGTMFLGFQNYAFLNKSLYGFVHSVDMHHLVDMERIVVNRLSRSVTKTVHLRQANGFYKLYDVTVGFQEMNFKNSIVSVIISSYQHPILRSVALGNNQAR